MGTRRADPTIGTIRSAQPAEISDEVVRLLDARYSTLKLKIGKDGAADLANVSAAQRAIRRGGLLRIDANQGTRSRTRGVVPRPRPGRHPAPGAAVSGGPVGLDGSCWQGDAGAADAR